VFNRETGWRPPCVSTPFPAGGRKGPPRPGDDDDPHVLITASSEVPSWGWGSGAPQNCLVPKPLVADGLIFKCRSASISLADGGGVVESLTHRPPSRDPRDGLYGMPSHQDILHKAVDRINFILSDTPESQAWKAQKLRELCIINGTFRSPPPSLPLPSSCYLFWSPPPSPPLPSGCYSPGGPLEPFEPPIRTARGCPVSWFGPANLFGFFGNFQTAAGF